MSPEDMKVKLEGLAMADRALADCIGFSDGLYALRNHPEWLPQAVPVLADLLPRLQSFAARYAVLLEMFYYDKADQQVYQTYVDELRSLADPLRAGDELATTYACGLTDTLRGQIKLRHYDEVISLVQDKALGRARADLLLALPRFKSRRAKTLVLLIESLNDPELIQYSIDALGKLKDKAAIPHLLPYVDDPMWTEEAQSALRALGLKIGGVADEEALQSYRLRAYAIDRAKLDLTSLSFEIQEASALFRQLGQLLDGFGPVEAQNIIFRMRDMEVEGADMFGFDVEGAPFYVDVFMDDTDATEITLGSTEPTTAIVQSLVEEYLPE